jgi:hypothetical protein
LSRDLEVGVTQDTDNRSCRLLIIRSVGKRREVYADQLGVISSAFKE